MDSVKNKTYSRMEQINKATEFMRLYYIRENEINDWKSGFDYGVRQSRKEMAQEMKADNMPVDQIIKYTGLTEKQIKDL